jgi:hypothetical protein
MISAPAHFHDNDVINAEHALALEVRLFYSIRIRLRDIIDEFFWFCVGRTSLFERSKRILTLSKVSSNPKALSALTLNAQSCRPRRK